jgi:hypothetical protein
VPSPFRTYSDIFFVPSSNENDRPFRRFTSCIRDNIGAVVRPRYAVRPFKSPKPIQPTALRDVVLSLSESERIVLRCISCVLESDPGNDRSWTLHSFAMTGFNRTTALRDSLMESCKEETPNNVTCEAGVKKCVNLMVLHNVLVHPGILMSYIGKDRGRSKRAA